MGDLMRVTANLPPRAGTALTELIQRTGDSRTDVIVTALMLYRSLLGDLAADRLCVDEGDGRIVRLRLIGASVAGGEPR